MPSKFEYELVRSSPKFLAKLYRNGHLFATGSASVSEESVIFYPNNPKSLAIFLGEKIKLKVKKTRPLISLTFSREHLDVSSDEMWFFEIVV